jgi:hypothetical protein
MDKQYENIDLSWLKFESSSEETSIKLLHPSMDGEKFLFKKYLELCREGHGYPPDNSEQKILADKLYKQEKEAFFYSKLAQVLITTLEDYKLDLDVDAEMGVDIQGDHISNSSLQEAKIKTEFLKEVFEECISVLQAAAVDMGFDKKKVESLIKCLTC